MNEQTDFQRTLDMAIDATRGGRLQEANQLLLHAARLDPSASTPYFLLGANAAEEGRNEAAESAFVACLTRAPNFAMARFQLGLLQITNSRPTVAAATWEPLFLLDDQQPLKHFAAAMMDITRGQNDSARQRMMLGIQLNQDNPALNRDMQGVLDRLGGEAPDPKISTDSKEPDGSATVFSPTEHVLISGYRQQ